MQMLAVTATPSHREGFSPRRSISAFTLIELSIVLVIIGLIAGGVLVGKDLIDISKARKDISQIEAVRVAVNTFKLKYNALPGDMPNPSNFFTVYSGIALGNNNGAVGAVVGGSGNYTGYCSLGCSDAGGESTLFWLQLSQSKLISLAEFPCCTHLETDSIARQGVGYPAIQGGTEFGLTITSVPNGLNNVFVYGARQYGVGSQSIANNSYFLSFFSSYIDTKMDDGNARTGKVQNKWSLDNSFSYADCHDSGTGLYYTDSTPRLCTLRIESGF